MLLSKASAKLIPPVWYYNLWARRVKLLSPPLGFGINHTPELLTTRPSLLIVPTLNPSSPNHNKFYLLVTKLKKLLPISEEVLIPDS